MGLLQRQVKVAVIGSILGMQRRAMCDELTLINIAGITISVDSRGLDRLPSFEPAMESFFVTTDVSKNFSTVKTPDVSIKLLMTDAESYCSLERELLFDSGALWRLYDEQEHYCFQLTSPKFGDIPYKIAHFHKDFSQGEIAFHRPFFSESQSLEPLEHPIGELLITHLLSQGRGIEIHGCGLVDQAGNGYLFAGQSGAGKSTTAQIWLAHSGAKILSDERVILRRQSDRVLMSGTPWHGEARLISDETVVLNKIFLLRHGRTNELCRYHTGEAVANLFACSFPPFYDSAGLAFSIDFLTEVAARVPCYELFFTPDERVINLITNHYEV